MKKKLLAIIILSMFVLLSAFGVDWKTELEKQFISDESIQLGEYNYGNLYKRVKNKIEIKHNLEEPVVDQGNTELKSAERINAFLYQSEMNVFRDSQIMNNGYLYGTIAKKPFFMDSVEKVPMIFGNEFSFSIPDMTILMEIGSDGYKKWLFFDGTYEKKKKTRYPFSKVYNDIIRNVNSSSHLIEKSHGIEFDYSGVGLDWYIIHNAEWPHDEINAYCFPWVENAADSGIGEWIEFDLSSPQSTTYILNGFVDGNRMHLYKATSRMKEAEFTGWTENSKEIKQNVHFEDFVYFKTVQFSEPVTKFRITIKETYPGEKWQDTAISAVMFPVLNK